MMRKAGLVYPLSLWYHIHPDIGLSIRNGLKKALDIVYRRGKSDRIQHGDGVLPMLEADTVHSK